MDHLIIIREKSMQNTYEYVNIYEYNYSRGKDLIKPYE